MPDRKENDEDRQIPSSDLKLLLSEIQQDRKNIDEQTAVAEETLSRLERQLEGMTKDKKESKDLYKMIQDNITAQLKIALASLAHLKEYINDNYRESVLETADISTLMSCKKEISLYLGVVSEVTKMIEGLPPVNKAIDKIKIAQQSNPGAAIPPDIARPFKNLRHPFLKLTNRLLGKTNQKAREKLSVRI